MADNMPQSLANHTKLHPPFHFFIIPVFAINFFVSIYSLIVAPGFMTAWGVVVAAALLTAGFLIRIYALKAQDRVIRLEERMRLASLVEGPFRARINDLTERQLIALRFASDAELPALAEKALAGKMPPKEIKQAIKNWRTDNFRI
jgi:4-amino-4-deoxy-L-arabinose transferase-like glycosyltransferase